MSYVRLVLAGGKKWIKRFFTLRIMAWQPVHPATLMDLFKIQNVDVVQSAGALGLLGKRGRLLTKKTN